MSNFVDECNICVRSGDGGAGCVSFRREAHVPYGGPDGGDGGSGGDVWLQADHNIASLLGFRDYPHRIAQSGTHGQGGKRHGRGGEDKIVHVPVGTVVKDHASGELLVDLVSNGDRWLASEGGRGGRGNARFLSNKRRAPKFAEQGEKGLEIWYRLELKLMADVALVGFPSVGKSTLISSVSRAKPKIADYPFTTLEPNLGVIKVDDDTELVMADLPGLIEGAADGSGLGHRFLRHIERARVLVYLLDLTAVDSETPDAQYEILRKELFNYQRELLQRPAIVIGSKSDVLTVQDWGPQASMVEMEISAITGQGLDALVWKLSELVNQARETEPQTAEFVVHRPEIKGVQVIRERQRVWRVQGREAERSVALSDMTDIGALDYARFRLNKLGVDRALKRAGAAIGDEVWIGDFVFEYQSDD